MPGTATSPRRARPSRSDHVSGTVAFFRPHQKIGAPPADRSGSINRKRPLMASKLVTLVRTADRIPRLILQKEPRNVIVQRKQRVVLGHISGGRVIDYEQVETLRQFLDRVVRELLQRTNLPPNLNLRMQLCKTLSCRRHRQIPACMPPRDARELYCSLQELILFVKHYSVNENRGIAHLRRAGGILKTETQWISTAKW